MDFEIFFKIPKKTIPPRFLRADLSRKQFDYPPENFFFFRNPALGPVKQKLLNVSSVPQCLQYFYANFPSQKKERLN